MNGQIFVIFTRLLHLLVGHKIRCSDHLVKIVSKDDRVSNQILHEVEKKKN